MSALLPPDRDPKHSDLSSASDLISAREAATLLGISSQTLRRWEKQGLIQSQRPDGKTRQYKKSEIEKLRDTRPLTIAEAAKFLGISVSTLRRLEKRGTLVPDRADRGERRYSQEVLRAYKEGKPLPMPSSAIRQLAETGKLQPSVRETKTPFLEFDDEVAIPIKSEKKNNGSIKKRSTQNKRLQTLPIDHSLLRPQPHSKKVRETLPAPRPSDYYRSAAATEKRAAHSNIDPQTALSFATPYRSNRTAGLAHAALPAVPAGERIRQARVRQLKWQSAVALLGMPILSTRLSVVTSLAIGLFALSIVMLVGLRHYFSRKKAAAALKELYLPSAGTAFAASAATGKQGEVLLPYRTYTLLRRRLLSSLVSTALVTVAAIVGLRTLPVPAYFLFGPLLLWFVAAGLYSLISILRLTPSGQRFSTLKALFTTDPRQIFAQYAKTGEGGALEVGYTSYKRTYRMATTAIVVTIMLASGGLLLALLQARSTADDNIGAALTQFGEVTNTLRTGQGDLREELQKLAAQSLQPAPTVDENTLFDRLLARVLESLPPPPEQIVREETEIRVIERTEVQPGTIEAIEIARGSKFVVKDYHGTTFVTFDSARTLTMEETGIFNLEGAWQLDGVEVTATAEELNRTTKLDDSGSGSEGARQIGTRAANFSNFSPARNDVEAALAAIDTALASSSVTAGNDLDLTGTTLDIESTLDFVSTINLADTGTINGLDAIDSTTEATLEAALDIGGDISGTGLSSVTIGADKVLESHLKVVDAATDEECLTYETTTGDFEWQSCSVGSMTSFTLAGDTGSSQTISDGNTLTIATGAGLTATAGATDTVTLSVDDDGLDFAQFEDTLDLDAALAVNTGGNEITFNEDGGDSDFRIEGDTNANLFFADASADAIGLGTSSPTSGYLLDTRGNMRVGTGSDVAASRSVITFNNGGYGAPAVTGSTSNGDKLIFYDPGTTYRVGIGINVNAQMWFQSAPGSTGGFSWHTGISPVEVASLDGDGTMQIDGDLTISGDDLFMGTNTSGHILVADGTNFNPVAVSGDITIDSAGATSIGADKVLEADLKAVDSAVDEECLTYETTTGDFEWQSCGGGGVTADSLDFTDFQDTLDLDAALAVNTTGLDITFNEDGGDSDFRIEGDTTTNLFFVDASADAIGIGDSTPDFTLDVAGTFGTDGNATIGGDLTITGDDLTMGTNTSGFILVADGTNFNPVAMSGDITIDSTGATAIGADKVTEADLKVVDAASDEECLTYETTTGDFEWQSCSGVGGGMTSFTLAGDTGVSQTIEDANTLTIATGAGLTATAGATDTVTISVDNDGLDFAQFEDTLDLDAGLTLNQGTNTWTQNFTGTTTTGSTYNANSLTTGTGLALASSSTALTSGRLLTAALAASGSLSAKTGELAYIDGSRTNTATAGTVADDYDLFALIRTNVQNGVGGTLTAAGSVLRLANIATQTAGTLTDTTKGLEIGMDADGSGDAIFVDSNGSGTTSQIALNIDSESTTADVIAIDGTQLNTGDALQITLDSDNVTTGQAIRVFSGASANTQVFAVDEDGDTVMAGDLTVSGNDIAFGNAETITNTTDGTIAFTDGTNTLFSIVDNGTTGSVTISEDLTVSGGQITMSNNTSGNLLIANGSGFFSTQVSGDITIDGTGATAIGADKVTEADLKVVDTPIDEECLTYETTTGDFEWQSCNGSVVSDSLDFTEFQDTLDLDAALTLNQGTNTWTQNFTGTTTDGFTLNANALEGNGQALVVNATNVATANGLFVPVDFNITNTQGTSANANVYGLQVEFTQNPSVANNTEYVLNVRAAQTANTTDTDITALLLLDNDDTSASGSIVVENGILLRSGIADGITNGINFDDTDIVNEIVLQNDEVIHNNTDGTIAFTDGTNELLSIVDAGTQGNIGIGVNSFGNNASAVLAIASSTAPTSSINNGVQLWAEDVAGSHELRVRDEAGNATTLSPHNFSLFTPQADYILPWSFYSKNDDAGKEINVDMYGAISAIELLSGRQFIYAQELASGASVRPPVDGTTSLVARVAQLEERVAGIESKRSLLEAAAAAVPPQPVEPTLPNNLLTDALFSDELVFKGALTAENTVTITGPLLVKADLTVAGSLVADTVKVAESLTVEGDTTIFGKLTAKSDVAVEGTLSLSEQQGGYATVRQFSRTVTVPFSKPFLAPPLVTANALSGFVEHRIADISPTSFTIELAQSAESDLTFSWVALAVTNPSTTVGEEGVPPEPPAEAVEPISGEEPEEIPSESEPTSNLPAEQPPATTSPVTTPIPAPGLPPASQQPAPVPSTTPAAPPGPGSEEGATIAAPASSISEG